LYISKIEVEMRQRINIKLNKIGATSKKAAVTPMEANLDLQEKFWLPYLVGNIPGSILKTRNNR
jgi:hypothetical protein